MRIRYIPIMLCLLGIVLFSLSNVSGAYYTNNTLTNNILNSSLTSENVSFVSSQDIFRYLKIPSTVSALTNGYLNLSWFNFNFYGADNYVNNSFYTNESVTVDNSTHFVDQNESSYTYVHNDPANIAVFDIKYYVNYSIPLIFSNISGNSSNCFRNDNCGAELTINLDKSSIVNTNPGSESLTLECYNTNHWELITNTATWTNAVSAPSYTLNIPVGQNGTNLTSIGTCYLETYGGTDKIDKIYCDGTVYFSVPPNCTTPNSQLQIKMDLNKTRTTGSGGTVDFNAKLYDMKVYFNGSHESRNPYLNISDSNAWSYINLFSQTNNKTINLASVINKYITASYLIGSYYYIPFIFRPNGFLQYLDLQFSNEGYIENSQTYQTTAYELSPSTFILNITYDGNYYTSSSANLIYNGTSYLADASGTALSKIFTKTIDIPIGTNGQNKSFYWSLSLTNSSGVSQYNLTMYNQTILSSNFSYCTSGTKAVNYTIRDESTNVLINTNFKSAFTWRLNLSSTSTRNISVDLSGANNYSFCISPNATFYVDASMELSAPLYDTRNLFLKSQAYSNITTDRILYLMNISEGTDIIIQVKNPGLNPLKDYAVKVYRFMPSLNSYILVEEDTTDIYGQIVARLIENNVKYKIEFYDNSSALVKTTSDLTIACLSSICVLPFIIEDTTNDFNRFNNLTNYDYSLSFDNSTNMFTFSWNDNTGTSATHRLLVERLLYNGTISVCNTTSTALIGSLTCSVGSGKYSYNAQAFRGTDNRRIASLSIKVGNDYAIFGLEGLFVSFILLFTLIIVGIYSPAVGIVLYLIGLIIIGTTQIVYINPAVIIAQIVIGVTAIWSLRT